MRVQYRSVRVENRRPVYQQGPVEFCCAAMCRWWNVLIGFGAGDRPSTDRGVNLLLPRQQAGGAHAVELVPISCCPFCGEAIEANCR